MREPVLSAIPSGQRTRYAPLDQPQRYERIAARLADDVRAGRLAPGQRLPSERELARRLQVGRASVREALAALALRGVLETRPGSGSFVARDARDRVGENGTAPDGANGHLPADASPSEVLEARLALEPRVARLAARTGGADAELERLVDAMDAGAAERAAWNDADRRFHHRIAVLTGNSVLIALADHVAALMDQALWQRLRDESVADPAQARLHAAEHRLIHAAIADGDAGAAEFHATQHLERVRRSMTLDQE